MALKAWLHLFVVVLAALAPAAASAHPHVWVEARANVLFDENGLVAGIRNEWVFDAMYSSFAVQGLEKGGKLASRQDLAPLAKTNVESLAEYGYFTYAKADGHKLTFGKPKDYFLEERADKRVVLRFTLPLLEPTQTGRAMSFQIYDPTYFVDFELAAKDPVRLVDAPTGCSMSVLGANPLVVADGQKLAKSFDSGLTPDDSFAVKMAGRVIVACPRVAYRIAAAPPTARSPDASPPPAAREAAPPPRTAPAAPPSQRAFAVGANEGSVGAQSGLGAWLLGKESGFYRELTDAVRAVNERTSALLMLVALSFGYGIFHAAGPGHGKAVITSYMVSNEVALRRGFLIALAAALLQGLIAIAIVGVAAFVFDATAQRMTGAAQAIERLGFVGIVALGLLLVWRKGRALVGALRPLQAPVRPASTRPSVMRPIAGEAPLLFAAAGPSGGGQLGFRPRRDAGPSRFIADDGADHAVGCECGALHIPAAATLEGRRFDMRAAALAVVAAGARPCSGAMLILVFSLSQGLFVAGVAATFAMALGTAITTGGLATFAVFAKDAALRLGAAGGGRYLTIGRLIEFGAAALVLVVGIALLAASLTGVHAGA